MSKRKNKFTRQGVRDLSSLPAKSTGREYIPPPVGAFECKHKETEQDEMGDSYCLDCGQGFERKSGKPLRD